MNLQQQHLLVQGYQAVIQAGLHKILHQQVLLLQIHLHFLMKLHQAVSILLMELYGQMVHVQNGRLLVIKAILYGEVTLLLLMPKAVMELILLLYQQRRVVQVAAE